MPTRRQPRPSRACRARTTSPTSPRGPFASSCGRHGAASRPPSAVSRPTRSSLGRCAKPGLPTQRNKTGLRLRRATSPRSWRHGASGWQSGCEPPSRPRARSCATPSPRRSRQSAPRFPLGWAPRGRPRRRRAGTDPPGSRSRLSWPSPWASGGKCAGRCRGLCPPTPPSGRPNWQCATALRCRPSGGSGARWHPSSALPLKRWRGAIASASPPNSGLGKRAAPSRRPRPRWLERPACARASERVA
mmetsp:Transcript_21748/g.82729  ORF Transcript_21748/g.82729 Transcript_21748/m.82729 type:complete len:246 (+) Transcript_21748:1352-2089(+)